MAQVSVWMTAYNHEKFIAQAIESVLMQQTDFDFEIIIGEDCSTDSTREILLHFKEQHPHLIRLFLPEKNLGMVEMFKATYSLCSGEYVAWLDGDDYWTDSQKLQKQVDFLKKNEDYVFCFHRVEVFDEVNGKVFTSGEPVFKQPDNSLLFTDFLHFHNPVDTPSVLYRNVLDKQLPDWYYNLPFPDMGFYFLLLAKGKAKFFPDVMAVYRIHKGGAWSGSSDYTNHSKYIQFFQVLKSTANNKYRHQINKVIGYYLHLLLKIDVERKDIKRARNRFNLLLFKHWNTTLANRKEMLEIGMNLYFK